MLSKKNFGVNARAAAVLHDEMYASMAGRDWGSELSV
jgi:hypothetical protein